MAELPHIIRGVDHVAFPTFDPAATVSSAARAGRSFWHGGARPSAVRRLSVA
jgi:hypothetical protein